MITHREADRYFNPCNVNCCKRFYAVPLEDIMLTIEDIYCEL